jgi:hypothetical protein
LIPTDVLRDYCTRAFLSQPEGITAYWVKSLGSRRQLCRDMCEGIGDVPLLPIAVEAGQFQDADGVIDDLNSSLRRCADWFDGARRAAIAKERRLTLLLVSRRALGVPQLSSPVELPDWFPVWAGHFLTVTIRDITSTVDTWLSNPAINIGAIRESMALLEDALSSRLLEAYETDSRAASSLWDRIQIDDKASDTFPGLIESSRRALRDLTELSAFRPGAADGRLVVARLFRLWLKSSPDELHKVSVALARALALDESRVTTRVLSLASLLTRPVSPPLSQLSAEVLFCRNLIIALAHGSQFSTAAAHAADYPRFPFLLLDEYAQDISRSCVAAAQAIRSLER